MMIKRRKGLLLDDSRKNKRLLQSMISKIISRKAMDNFNKFLHQNKITNQKISQAIGAPDNAFNKIINEMAVPTIPTLARYVHAASQLLEIEDKMQIYSKIFADEEIDKAVGILNQISDSDINDLISENKEFFKGLGFYFSINESKKNNPFTIEERDLYEKIKEMIDNE
jgi:hypothetical protein